MLWPVKVSGVISPEAGVVEVVPIFKEPECSTKSGAPGREQPQLPCARDGRGAIARAELGIDAADVGVDRVDGDVELARDLRPRQVCR